MFQTLSKKNGVLMFLKGYKIFNHDWSCRNQKYDVGKTYFLETNIALYESGFHFCMELRDCFEHYECIAENRYAEVEALGKTYKDRRIIATDIIRIIREIPFSEVLESVNPGQKNIGFSNIGNYNTGSKNIGLGNIGDSNNGNWNLGNGNVGSMNTGEYNTGDANSGNRNSADCNFGDQNTGEGNIGNFNTSSNNIGNCNSGFANIGNSNSGDCNCIDFSNGIFNSQPTKIFMFNRPSRWTLEDWRKSNQFKLMQKHFKITEFFESYLLSDKEKSENPNYDIIGGVVKKYSYKDAWKKFWQKLKHEERKEFMNLPNFDKQIFQKITGISI